MRQMEQQYSPEELDSAIPEWQDMHSLQDSLAEVLPEEYFSQYSEDNEVDQPQKRVRLSVC